MTRGSIFAIGGREVRSGQMSVLEHFVERCGRSDARLVVISTASPRPQERVPEYEAAFDELGVGRASFFHQDQRSEAADPKMIEALDEANGLFFTGGNQLKLVTILGGTAFEKKMLERHREGLHIAGTSAGAAALSAVMIARGRARSATRLSSLRMSPGFGLLPRIIIDQHFRERDRFGRLLAAVTCNPAMLGCGLDEDTAFELDAGDRVRVVGSGSLTILDASELSATNIDVVPEDVPAAFSGMRVDVLTAGWSYDIEAHSVERPAIEPNARKPIAS